MAKRPDHSEKADAELSFEDALAQVESVIEAIESGEIGLEKSLTEYERGVRLIKRCRDVLATAEQRIEMLSKDLKPVGKGEPD
ncbi:MAG: exodeoxyribonuclease VII small subunit [Planctomycetes bacterium]|nr:exodeoxyribonuclease VII small subunit [Planctomycetota bacterium]